MNKRMVIQKQNIDGLNALNSQKTQRLIGKIQKHPAIARRLQQISGPSKIESATPMTPSSKRSPIIAESSKSGFTSCEDTVFKKRKLNDETPQKVFSSPGARSNASTDPDWNDITNPPKLNLFENGPESKPKSSLSKKTWVKTINPFSSSSAFSNVKMNRQVN